LREKAMNDRTSPTARPTSAKWRCLRWVLALGTSLCACACVHPPHPARSPTTDLSRIDENVRLAMAATGARGLAIAVVDGGQVVFTRAYGVRDASGAPLREDTVMYGASLTKAAFGYLVMQLVEEGRLGLDVPLAGYLPQPLPSYASSDIVRRYSAFAGLANDERWRKLTARILLTHSGGFSNFYFQEPDKQLRIHFEPGSRYAYSGDGLILLQFVLEQGLGLDVGAEMNRRLFAPNGMTRSSLIWRADFRPNLADGFGSDGRAEPHDERSKVRASGSLDTSIADMGRLAASYVRGDGLSAAARAELVKPHVPINTRSQFPSFQEPLSPSPLSRHRCRPGRHCLQRPARCRLLQRGAQRLHREHLGLCGSRSAGGEEEDRTPDLCIANAALSQLSYPPTHKTPAGWRPSTTTAPVCPTTPT
jgi:CubicO group peptidase (beta-lactamase class C family)